MTTKDIEAAKMELSFAFDNIGCEKIAGIDKIEALVNYAILHRDIPLLEWITSFDKRIVGEYASDVFKDKKGTYAKLTDLLFEAEMELNKLR